MKKILSVFLILLVFGCIFANEIGTSYIGTFSILDDFHEKTNLPAELILNKNEYIFKIDGIDSIKWFMNQYKKHIKDNYYFEIKGTYSLKSDLERKIITFDNVKSPIFGTFELFSCDSVLFLLNEKGIVFQSQDHVISKPQVPFISKVLTSSFLTEKNTLYDGKSFINSTSDFTPWCEAKKDDGKGEWIELEVYSETEVKSFLFINGFVDFKRPDLYKNNNRVKLLEIKTSNELNNRSFELEDTREIQKIRLPVPLKAGEKIRIRFTIMDFYPGLKWNDTCISRIIPWYE